MNPPADGLPVPQRYRAIATIAVGLVITVLSSAIANIALPVIGRDLGTTAARSIWIVNALQIAMAVSLLPAASLGDVYGYARIYRIGLVVFGLASLGCALAQDLATIVFWRVLQGLGAAGILSVNPALVRFTFPRAKLGQGMAMTALVVATSSALGPTVAAAILSVASWHWLFAINVPFSALALLLAARALPQNESYLHGFDIASALLSAATFALFILGFDALGHGQPLLAAIGLPGAIGFGFVFILRQKGLAAPMLPLDFFRDRLFSLSVCTSITSFGAAAIAFVAMPFYLQDVLGRSQVETGLLMTPWPLAIAVAAPIAGRLSDRFPAGLLGGIGLGVLSVGLASLALLTPETGSWDIAARMVLCGVGFGFFQTPNNRILMGSVPRERSGSAGGIMSTARVMGQTMGAAAVGIIFGLAATHAAGPGQAMWLAAIVAGIAAAFSVTRLFGGR